MGWIEQSQMEEKPSPNAAHSDVLWTYGSPCCAPNAEGPKVRPSIQYSSEEFKTSEDKKDDKKLDLKCSDWWAGKLMRMRIEEGSKVSQGHMDM